MPYIMTTKRRVFGSVFNVVAASEGRNPWSPRLRVATRRAVATLDGVWRELDEHDAVELLLFDRAKLVMARDHLGWDACRGLIYERARTELLPESGGTITLPDGTEIEVQPRDAVHMARDAGVEAPGLTDEQICAAWNETH